MSGPAPDLRILPLREEEFALCQHCPSIITVEQIEYMHDQRYRPDVIDMSNLLAAT
jgi:hypothetical protein